MIVKATQSDMPELKELWKICFPKEDNSYIDYYFRNVWKPENCYVTKEDGKIISTISRNKHDIMFQGRIIRTSMITGVATLPEYRNRGYMKELMTIVLDACEHTELMTFIRTETPELYAPFGFEQGFPRTQWSLQRHDLKRVSTFGCAYEIQALDMLKVYSAYIRRFSGFYTRDLKYFIDYKKEIAQTGGKLIGYFNGQDRIDGYAAVTMQGSDLYIDELVYLDSTALTKLLNACFQERPRVHFNVSKAENLTQLFPNAKHKDFSTTMVKINNYELFNKLFSTDVTNVQDALAVSRKPLNQNESR